MKIDLPLPVLLRGCPPRGSLERDIWMTMTAPVDVPEYATGDFETVLEIANRHELARPDLGVIARDGKTYSHVRACPRHDVVDRYALKAFPKRVVERLPGYIGAGIDMSPYAVSRPLMERQSRAMFLESLSMDRRNVWPTAAPLRNARFSRDEFDLGTYDGNLDLGALSGTEEHDEDRRAAEGRLVFVDGELWAECGKPCVVVRTEFTDIGTLVAIGLTTLPEYADTSFQNAYFSLDEIEDAKDYASVMNHLMNTFSRHDHLPEFDYVRGDATAFACDEWEAERMAEVLGADVAALVRNNPETAEKMNARQRAAVSVALEAAKSRNEDRDAETDLLEIAPDIYQAWVLTGRRNVAAELPPNRRAMMEPVGNRAATASSQATISLMPTLGRVSP